MRAVVTRVSSASVSIDGATVVQSVNDGPVTIWMDTETL